MPEATPFVSSLSRTPFWMLIKLGEFEVSQSESSSAILFCWQYGKSKLTWRILRWKQFTIKHPTVDKIVITVTPLLSANCIISAITSKSWKINECGLYNPRLHEYESLMQPKQSHKLYTTCNWHCFQRILSSLP